MNANCSNVECTVSITAGMKFKLRPIDGFPGSGVKPMVMVMVPSPGTGGPVSTAMPARAD